MGLGATSKMGSIHFVFTTQSKRPLGNRDLDLTITHYDVPRKAASENAPLGGPSLRSTSGTVYLFHLPSPRSCILHAHVTEGFSFEIFLNSSLCLPRPITLIQLTSHKWLLWPAPNWVIFSPLSGLYPLSHQIAVWDWIQCPCHPRPPASSPTRTVTIGLASRQRWLRYSHQAQLLRLQPPRAHGQGQPAPLPSLCWARTGSGFPSRCSQSAGPTQRQGHGTTSWSRLGPKESRDRKGPVIKLLAPPPPMGYFRTRSFRTHCLKMSRRTEPSGALREAMAGSCCKLWHLASFLPRPSLDSLIRDSLEIYSPVNH